MNSIIYAKEYISSGNYEKGIDLYVKAFETDPELKQLFEQEFRTAILKCNEVLSEANRFESIIANFTTAIKLFPDNVFFVNESGRHLFMYGFYEEAGKQFQQALSTDSGSVDAEKNLNSIKNLLIERWHFRMLNDKIRNESYRAALHEKVVPKKTRVLDLGTGTGLLAMYAAECKPQAITACDTSKLMTHLTECILEENRLFMSIAIINKMSTEMNAVDIKGKCSLLVTELFDAGLFGEHILLALDHAWENLLLEKADIIPQRAEFFIVGANSELMNSKYQLRQTPKSLLKVDQLNVHIALHETYDCEDVYQYKDMKYMTEPHSIVKIDFTNLDDIKDKLSGSKKYVVECKAKESGQINTFIGWFNLHLTENITITTDPRDKNRGNAWQQAVFFDGIPRNVQENETFNLDFVIESERITMKQDPLKISKVSSEIVRFLNDIEYLNMIKNCIGMTCIHVCQMSPIAEVSIVDLSPFPWFGLLMLQRGIKSLTCYVRSPEDQAFMENVFKANGVDPHKVIFYAGRGWSDNCFDEQKYHVVFVHVFDLCGELNMEFNELALNLNNNHLMTGGLFMPSAVTIMGQIVNSEWLDVTNRVYDHNLDYTASKFVNTYQVSQNFNLDFTNLEYTPLTDPVVIGDCFQLSAEVHNVPITNGGEANAILCWYDIELMNSCERISTKRPYSFLDGTAFLADPPKSMVAGDIANILCCSESDGLFKLIIDNENT